MMSLFFLSFQFSDEELHCSGEEIKARLEQLQNEKVLESVFEN